ncbi:phage baseplate assembly protein V [Streptomyces sp. NPDC050534]|uniref:phage baseplate assembly protein V n=1 Tax=Streptomyces sp. NPDC050534 TaxID=3365625 RepID=UPI0037A9DF79
MSPAEQDRPAFEVRVAGTALQPLVAADVVELDVSEEVGRHGRLTLIVQNWDADSRSVRHSDDGPFVPGTAIAVSLGYHSQLATVFDGVIASLTTHFPRDGRPVLRVEGRSKSILLEHPPRSRQLADVSDADVAAAVGADYSLSTDAADGITKPFVVSDRISDWELLKHRAGELGWVTYVRGDTLVLRPPAQKVQPIQVEHGRHLVELHLTQDLTHAISSAVGVAWDPAALDAAESEQSAASAGVDIGDRTAHDTAADDSGWPLRDERAESPAVVASDEADARAVATQRNAALAHYFGSGVVQGNPALRCDGWVSIAGVGKRMSGPHYVTAVRHRLSADGYLTEFQVGSPPALLPPSRTRDRGLALGVVEALDDPQSLNRVKVRLSWRADAGDGVWARPANLDAGDGYGAVLVPNVGQEVLVGFVDGDPATPVVLGSLYNGTQQPPVVVDADTNAVRALMTPDGHALHLEDGDSAAAKLLSGKGHSLVLNDKGSEVVITHADSGNAIRLSADGIELTAAQGDIKLSSSAGTITLDSLKLQAKASGPSAIESSATFELKASGSLGLKGSLVTIN